MITQVNGFLLTADPRTKISGVVPVRLSKFDETTGAVTPVAMYLPRPVATAVGVGSKLTGFEVRVGTLATARRACNP